MTSRPPGLLPLQAATALPAAATALLVVGAAAGGTGGAVGGADVLLLCTGIVAVTMLVATASTGPALVAVAWLVVDGFSAPPYAQLRALSPGTARPFVLLTVTAAIATIAGYGTRARHRRTSDPFSAVVADGFPARGPARWPTLEAVNPVRSRRAAHGISRARALVGLGAAAVTLPVLTTVLAALRPHLSFADDLLLYLVAVVGITVLGGFLPAVAAAVAASLCLNWFFTPPVHTWTIEAPQNLLALLLFVTFAICVSSVVHLAAQRAAEARSSNAEAAALLALAETVLAGQDSAAAVLDQLQQTHGLPAELHEQVGEAWVRVAGAGRAAPGAPTVTMTPRPGLRLVVTLPATGDDRVTEAASPRVLAGYSAQAAAALDRQRLRAQASQSEALAEGNRMRTALLAAVSHDLRTPLSSIKAGASTLRQTDVVWSDEDRAELLATIEEGADRLGYLIGNLLDMSRLTTGSLEPFLRPTAVDEIAVLALQGLPGADRADLEVPDDLPLVAADPGLLERALANLISNALRFSPVEQPPTVRGWMRAGQVCISVIDHGPGVPDTQRETIFEPFQRLGDQSPGSGVGLGLAVARGFIDLMGGSIDTEQTASGGLTVHVQLPAWAGRTTDARAQPGRSRP